MYGFNESDKGMGSRYQIEIEASIAWIIKADSIKFSDLIMAS